MKYTPHYNQVVTIKYGLSVKQAIVLDAIYLASNWAYKQIIDNEKYYYLSRGKLIDELPSISTTKAGFGKHIRVLLEKDLIQRKIYENRPYYKVSDNLSLAYSRDSNNKCLENSKQIDTPSSNICSDNKLTTYNQTKDTLYIDLFEKVWKLYPKKTGKRLALDKFLELDLYNNMDSLVNSIGFYNTTKQVEDGYILDFKKFLDCYEDYTNGLPEGIIQGSTIYRPNREITEDDVNVDTLVDKIYSLFSLIDQQNNSDELLKANISTFKLQGKDESFFTSFDEDIINQYGGLQAIDIQRYDDGFKNEIREVYKYNLLTNT